MQLSLANSGQTTKSQRGVVSNAVCQWSGSDAIVDQINAINCWKPTNSFFPALSLQPSLIPSNLGLVDLGTRPVGFSSNSYRHLQGKLVFAGQNAQLASLVAQQGIVDLGLDPATMLPAVLAYSVIPDVGSPTPIAIEFHYSNYQLVNGVEIPFSDQRYVNGSLQLQINVSAAQII